MKAKATKPPAKLRAKSTDLTEDEADYLVGKQRLKEPAISFRTYLKQRGYVLAGTHPKRRPA